MRSLELCCFAYLDVVIVVSCIHCPDLGKIVVVATEVQVGPFSTVFTA